MRPFLQVDDRIWRGPQPDEDDLLQLKEAGLRAVFNLREESTLSRELASECGLAYHHIPVEDWTVPHLDQVDEFFEMLAQTGFAPALVHCWGGIGRTGIFVSLYRVRNGMGIEEAIRLSDLETPHMQMSGMQKEWLFRSAHHFAPRH